MDVLAQIAKQMEKANELVSICILANSKWQRNLVVKMKIKEGYV